MIDTQDLKEVEAKAKQKFREDLATFTAEQDSLVADKNKDLAKVKAETNKQIAVVKEQEKADVMEIDSKAKLTVAQINSKRDVLLSKIRQEGKAEADRLKVESGTYVATKKAEASREIAENEAKCMELTAEAEAAAASELGSRRMYEKKMRSLQSLRALSQNNELCIAGNHNDNIVAQLIANNQQGNILGVNMNK